MCIRDRRRAHRRPTMPPGRSRGAIFEDDASRPEGRKRRRRAAPRKSGGAYGRTKDPGSFCEWPTISRAHPNAFARALPRRGPAGASLVAGNAVSTNHQAGMIECGRKSDRRVENSSEAQIRLTSQRTPVVETAEFSGRRECFPASNWRS